MTELSIVGVDLAERVLQVHGVTSPGEVLLRKKLSRAQFARFLTEIPRCIVAMEACASTHYWGRGAHSAGHEVRIVPAAYVKPFVNGTRVMPLMLKLFRKRPCGHQCGLYRLRPRSSRLRQCCFARGGHSFVSARKLSTCSVRILRHLGLSFGSESAIQTHLVVRSTKRS